MGNSKKPIKNVIRYTLYATQSMGFTLIEVLVASLIFVVVISVAIGVFVSAVTVQSKTDAIQKLSQSARYAIESISREAKSSKSITVIDGGANGEDQLVIEPRVGETKTYSKSSGKLVLDETGTSLLPSEIIVLDWKVTDKSETLTESYPLVQIKLTLQYNTSANNSKIESYTQTYQTSFTNRNYLVADFQTGN